jgi:hypothetical protein
VKLPAPDLGTAEQAGPKSAVVAADEDEAGADDATCEGDGADADPLELHAAAPMARLAASPETARRRYFMVSPR